jgi:uncharacterized protein YbjT (DUF2867 family)
MSVNKRKILVTGATGEIGGALVRLLAGGSGLQVIAGARSPEKAKGLGVPVVMTNWRQGAIALRGPPATGRETSLRRAN